MLNLIQISVMLHPLAAILNLDMIVMSYKKLNLVLSLAMIADDQNMTKYVLFMHTFSSSPVFRRCSGILDINLGRHYIRSDFICTAH